MTTETTMAGMRSVANLKIDLGMFGFPVKVYKATEDPGSDVGATMVHVPTDGTTCGHHVNYIKRCSACEKDLQMSDIGKAYVGPDGQQVVLMDAEVKALKPEAAQRIKVLGYVGADDIDPAYMDGTVYYLMPGEKDDTTFVCWRDALNGRWAIGSVVMYGREHIVAVRALAKALNMYFVRTNAEIRDVTKAPGYDKVREVAPAEYGEMMDQLIGASRIALDDVVIDIDEGILALRNLIAARAAGQPAPVQPTIDPAAPSAPNLMAMLKASLAAKGLAA